MKFRRQHRASDEGNHCFSRICGFEFVLTYEVECRATDKRGGEASSEVHL